jgi:pimeloyl-ACP methyl ester carboxylesterase
MSDGVRERVVRFGPRESLVGILATPKQAPKDLPHVIVVNAGIIHRVGPNRLYVDIARAVAAVGYPVLRFDLSGLGDSDDMLGGASLTESAVRDIRLAMTHLEATRQATKFLVFGLCSGANHAAVTAFVEPRVVGLMLIDPSVQRTRRSKIVHVIRRLRHASTLREVVLLRHPVFRRSAGGRSSAAMSVAQAAEGQSGQRATPDTATASPADTRQSIEALVARNVHMMLVFTGGVNHQYNYYEQLHDLLPGLDFRGLLRLHYMPDTDHTVSDVAGRATLLARLVDWLQGSFPSREARVAATASDMPSAAAGRSA